MAKINIGISGVPGTGKSSLARSLAGSLATNKNIKTVELISEYARTYIAKYGSIDSIWEQYKILDKQVDMENVIPKHTDVLITDSPVTMYFHYTLDAKKDSSKDSMVLEDMFHKINLLNANNRYDIIFHVPPTFAPNDDGIRSKHLDPMWREESDKSIRFICGKLFPPKKFVVVEPLDLMERVKFCNNVLQEYIGIKEDHPLPYPVSMEEKMKQVFLGKIPTISAIVEMGHVEERGNIQEGQYYPSGACE